MTTAPVATVIRPADPRWGGHDGLFGGYAVAVLVDAVLTAEPAGGRMASVTASFVARTEEADAEVVLERVHDGRATAVVRAALVQAGRPRVHATAELLRGIEVAPRYVRTLDPPPPPLPDRSAESRHDYMAVTGILELRMCAPPELAATTDAWVRRRPGLGDIGLRSDEALVTTMLDLPTPGLFGESPAPTFVPSLDYAVHFAPRAAPLADGEWLHLRHATAWATDHHCVDETTIATADGRLLAQLRQTRAVRWP